jgi:carbonic anhydrase
MSQISDTEGRFRSDRASFLKFAGLGLGAAAISGPLEARAADPAAGPPRKVATPAEALAELKNGDARFAAGSPANCGSQTSRMAQLGAGQNPFVVILGCSDSRVPNDTIFDQRPGNIFGVRVAGNYVTNDGLGSIEYGVAALKSVLVVVLGHEGCGAVKAAIAHVKDGTTQPGHIEDVVAAIVPAAKTAKNQSGDWLDNAIAENVRMNVSALSLRSNILRDAVKSGQIGIVGGVYNITNATVKFFE